MKNLRDLKKVSINLELEVQGRGMIIVVTRLLLLGPFYYIQTNFLYFFAHDCTSYNIETDLNQMNDNLNEKRMPWLKEGVQVEVL